MDHDLLSFVDARLGDWPLILVTNPKDAQFLAPHHEPTESIKHSTHIRSVVTHSFSTPQSGPTVIMSVMHCTQSQYSTVRAHSHNVCQTLHTHRVSGHTQSQYSTVRAHSHFSAINGSGPAYLSELLHVYTPSRTLCSSSDTRMLEIQQYKRKTHGFRTFSCFGPHIWNSLPQDLRHCSTLSAFKAKLKTFLFSQYFHPN